MSLVCRKVAADAELERFLRRQPQRQLYALGDLDEPWRQHTHWFTASDATGIRAAFLLYAASSLPVVIAHDASDTDAALALFRWLIPQLPVPYYCHLAPELNELFSAHFTCDPRGLHQLMHLASPPRPTPDLVRYAADPGHLCQLRRLSLADLGLLENLDRTAYPGHWFVPTMLEHGCYIGAFASAGPRGGQLLAVAGTHILSRAQRVAAIGNVTTHPSCRGFGLAGAVTAALCAELAPHVDTIGLNVSCANTAAIRAYQRIGFAPVLQFDELMVKARR